MAWMMAVHRGSFEYSLRRVSKNGVASIATVVANASTSSGVKEGKGTIRGRALIACKSGMVNWEALGSKSAGLRLSASAASLRSPRMWKNERLRP